MAGLLVKIDSALVKSVENDRVRKQQLDIRNWGTIHKLANNGGIPKDAKEFLQMFVLHDRCDTMVTLCSVLDDNGVCQKCGIWYWEESMASAIRMAMRIDWRHAFDILLREQNFRLVYPFYADEGSYAKMSKEQIIEELQKLGYMQKDELILETVDLEECLVCGGTILYQGARYCSPICNEVDMSSIDEGPWEDAGALFSPDRVYRYRLWRAWDETKPRCVFIMCNPSDADETILDPTVRRCVVYARDWGCGSLDVVNIFAFKDGDPEVMEQAYEDGFDIVGPENDRHILSACRGAEHIIAAWSGWGELQDRGEYMKALLEEFDLKVLKLNNDGTPGHPLYLRRDLKPRRWRELVG